MRKRIDIVLMLIMLSVMVFQKCRYDKIVDEFKPSIEVKTDTFYKTSIQFIDIPVKEYVTDSIIDTLYIEKESEKPFILPISQRYYRSDSYNIWISGFEPKLDSVQVFQRTNYITIDRKIESVLKRTKTDFYIKGGATMVGSRVMPNIGVTITTPSRLMFGADVGLFDSKVTYSINMGYRL